MYCEFCGAEMAADQRVCSKCGRERGSFRPAAAAAVPAGAAASGRVGDAFRDSWDAVRMLVTDPVGQINAAFKRLSPERALAAGLVLCVMFAILSSLGILFGARAVMAFMMGFGAFGASQFEVFIRGFAQMLLMAAVMVGVSLLLRRIAGQKSGVAADLFLVGVALTPLGLAMFLAGILGSAQLAMILLIAAYTFLVLLLFAGLTGVGGVSSRLAFIGVPALLILGAWLTQQLLSSMF